MTGGQRRSKECRPLKLLLVGSLPPPLGGTVVSLKHLIDQLGVDSNIELRVVSSSGIRGRIITGPFRLMRIVFKILTFAFQVDVITLHCATTALPFFGLLLLCIARLTGKPIIVRKFAGFDYTGLKKLQSRLAHFVVRHADLYLVETKQLLERAVERGLSSVEWFPNNRLMPDKNDSNVLEKRTCRRFLYLGHIRSVKGLPEIIKAGERFVGHDDIAIDVYGSLRHDMTKEDFRDLKKIRLFGIVPLEELAELMAGYDALLLPSYHEGEGYPGVILEAYAVGMPIICTRWQALPEIVGENSGILIEPHCVDSLHSAMKRLIEDDAYYMDLRRGVLKKRQEFSSTMWNIRFLQFCRDTIKKFELRKT